MTTTPNFDSLPDGVSMADLQKMMDKAAKPETEKSDGPFLGYTQEQVVEIAEGFMAAADEKLSHPILAKVVMHMLLVRMIEWHTNAGVHVARDSKADDDSFVYWLRDAGKFQAMLATLSGISVCNEDFTCSDK